MTLRHDPCDCGHADAGAAYVRAEVYVPRPVLCGGAAIENSMFGTLLDCTISRVYVAGKHSVGSTVLQ